MVLDKPIKKFQSTHPSGVRRVCVPASTHCAGDFNPRTPVGCDHVQRAVGEQLAISIHAPQWGATRRLSGHHLLLLFQSTHPSGVRRPGHHLGGEAYRNFNPRTPVGCDDAVTPIIAGVAVISIHAPQWGATARMGIAFHNMEAPSVLKTDFIAKIHVHRSIHKFSNQKHQQTIHF